ncbi:MAG: DUF1501 domain-containing protein [Verrucomicrobia bacterium]|jgi:hypothetical protein|nr:DUF1501 domain-containing protein [Verrucomicrobiota bacterium]MDA0725174.1 DUF1501 domain-containing protein [Verrucomicrobiota bacterium]MDA1046275.1 DUF1501 domain-containing protein [Verrucomicrobiota bacterium]
MQTFSKLKTDEFSPFRRNFLQSLGCGFGSMALGGLWAKEAHGGDIAMHHLAKAKAVIQIFCPGGVSQVDTWDYKPELAKRNGTPFDPDGKLQFFASKPGNCQGSFWKFRRHGACGRWISDLFPRLATCVDDMAFVHSMHSKSALHGPAMFMMNSGFILPGFPSMGAWVTYGLGSEADNLPAYVVLPDPRGLPPGGVINWGAGFLPAKQQGTTMQAGAGKAPLADLFPPQDFKDKTGDAQLLGLLNKRHAKKRPANSELEARIKAYEMAAKLQLSAPEATAIEGESAATHKLYQLEDEDIAPFGRQCLLARRLVERGVRFVQIFCGAENTTARKIRPNWDSHEDLPRDHGYWGRVLDGGASALLKDLKSHGLLDETLVICTSEFGRQPAAQGNRALGRDHNAGAFTAWLAGGGIKGGISYGATDELGWKAAEHPTYSYDFHATALHLLGIDHERLSFYHNGIQRRLTDVHGHVISELIA